MQFSIKMIFRSIMVITVLFLQDRFLLASALSQESSSDALTREVVALTSEVLEEDGIHRLIEIDQNFSTDTANAKTNAEAQRLILSALATTQDELGLSHVRSVFENAPERRASAAAALASATTIRPTDLQDWRFLVRSLPVVQGDDAVAVMNALQRFRTRANKGQWVRQVILVALELPDDKQSAATGLLRHWTGVPLRKADAPVWTLRRYQDWFSKEYPDQPEPVLPADAEGRKWTMASLEAPINDFIATDAVTEQGARVYEKAGCQKCHRRGKVGETLGPDLTSLGWRRQRREILRATLYPSHELNEEYPTVTVALKNGKTLTGMMSASSADTLAIVSSAGLREEFPRAEVEDIVNQKTSNMPDGLLEPLTKDEIISLIAWLSSVEGIERPHTDEGP
ncbi:MAG: c-type cytochrome [Planctomycetota bacterium]|nr:c-type cytochrome [Planctomycetota bacterium]